MKKRILAILLALSLWDCTAVAKPKLTPVSGDPFEKPVVIRCTCYTAKQGAITSSGEEVRPGIIAGRKEWQGCAALLYTYEIVEGEPVPKECIGIYQVLDTGAGIDTDGDGKGDSIKKGQSIDVFQPTMNQAYEWVDVYGDYVMLHLVRGEG